MIRNHGREDSANDAADCWTGNVAMDDVGFKSEVAFMCREGLFDRLYIIVTRFREAFGAEKVKELLDAKHKEGTNDCAPLLLAAKEGYAEICDFLIHDCRVDIETEGTIIFDGFRIEGATPLWCSAGSNNTTIVMMLIKFGADINHSTRSGSTPLRAACFDGRIEMVKLLLDHKADYNIPNQFRNTSLMISAFRGHRDVVTCLLEHGAPPDTQAFCGNTALHFAAEHGYVEIIKELVRFGATVVIENQHGMTPLLSGAERVQVPVVEHFLENPNISRKERIDAYELLGASYANDKDNYDLERCYHYLKEAMALRWQEPAVEKVLPPPIPAYGNRVECKNFEELRAIKYDANALQMESLAIRERILGSKNPEVPHQITYRGAVFADSEDYDRSLQLWLHSLTLRQASGAQVSKDLMRFAQLFCQMIYIGVGLAPDVLTLILEKTTESLAAITPKKLKEPRSETDEQHELTMVAIYLIVVVTKIIDVCGSRMKTKFFEIIYKLNETRCTTHDGNSLLHLAVNRRTPINDFHTRNLVRFPCVNAAELLLGCGADVNAINNKGESPLHSIVAYADPASDSDALHFIVSALLQHGAHSDLANARGESPMETAKSGVAERVLRIQSQLRLKCLAAKAVLKFELRYEGVVPRGLNQFIEMHGARSIREESS